MRKVIYIVVGLILFNFIFATGETTSDKNIQRNQNEKNIMNDSNDKYNILLIENESLKKEKQKLDSKISEMKKVGDYGILYNVDQYYNNAWNKLIVTLSIIGGILGTAIGIFQWKKSKELIRTQKNLEKTEKKLNRKIENSLEEKEKELNDKIKEINEKLINSGEDTSKNLIKVMKYNEELIGIKNEELQKYYEEKMSRVEESIKLLKEENDRRELYNKIDINLLNADNYDFKKHYEMSLYYFLENLKLFLGNNLIGLGMNLLKLNFLLQKCDREGEKIEEAELIKIEQVLEKIDNQIKGNIEDNKNKNEIMDIIKKIKENNKKS